MQGVDKKVEVSKFCHPEPAYAEAMLWLRAGRLDSGSRIAKTLI